MALARSRTRQGWKDRSALLVPATTLRVFAEEGKGAGKRGASEVGNSADDVAGAQYAGVSEVVSNSSGWRCVTLDSRAAVSGMSARQRPGEKKGGRGVRGSGRRGNRLADVTKPLGSAGNVCDGGNRVVFDGDGAVRGNQEQWEAHPAAAAERRVPHGCMGRMWPGEAEDGLPEAGVEAVSPEVREAKGGQWAEASSASVRVKSSAKWPTPCAKYGSTTVRMEGPEETQAGRVGPQGSHCEPGLLPRRQGGEPRIRLCRQVLVCAWRRGQGIARARR